LIAVPLAAPVHSSDMGVLGLPPPQLAPPSPHDQVGFATWYGLPFQGLETANGKRYDMYALTAAHRHFPLGSLVRVTNLRNNKSVMVRINDRGPWLNNSILDLSLAAARQLDMVKQGRVLVSLQPIALPGTVRN
jgi:rare lipoprotein A